MERGGVSGPVMCVSSCLRHRRPGTGPTISKFKTRDKLRYTQSEGIAGGGGVLHKLAVTDQRHQTVDTTLANVFSALSTFSQYLKGTGPG